MLNFIRRKTTLLAGMLAIIGLLSGFLLYRASAARVSAALPASSEKVANLTGETALDYLKKTGARDSLGEALNAALYKAEATENGAAAINHANQIKSNFTSQGLQLESKIKSEQWQSHWKLTSLGNDRNQRKIGAGVLQLRDSRVEIHREEINLTEYFNNTPAGLEHGFVLNERLMNGGVNLFLTVAIEGNLRAQTAATDNQKIVLLDEKNEAILTYDRLKVFDANGAELSARMTIDEKNTLTFEIADADAVYPVTIDPTFTRQAKITASDGSSGDLFGYSVAVSGNTAIVGASDDDIEANNDQGSAYVFVRNGTAWSLQQKLVATDGAAADFFGDSVAISNDIAIIGAGYDDVGSNVDQGSAYIFVRNGTTWSQQQKLVAADGAAADLFGDNVSISGSTAVVGAGYDDIGSNANQGSAYVFIQSGATWSLQQKLVATDGAAADLFGTDVAISSDTAIIGASEDDVGSNANQGSAYVFVRNGTTWTEQQKLVATDGAAADFFGFSVAISNNTAIVGAGYDDINSNANQGSAYVFVRNGTAWSQQQKLVATDGAAEDFFGLDVSISGDTVVVGASADDVGSSIDQGSAYVFSRDGATWTELPKLAAEDGAATDFFGFSVAASGNTIIVGAIDDDIGANSNQGSATVFASETISAVPSIASISPNTSGAGGAAFELTVNGSNFDANSIVRWNNQDRVTTFVSPTQLRAQISASDLQTPGQYPVTVFNSPPGGGLSNAVIFTVSNCTYSLNPTSTSFSATGGTSSANVIAPAGCAWTAVSNNSWITVTAGNTGSGNGTFSFSVSANTGAARTGTITVGGQTFTINQASGCTYALSSTSANIPAAGTNGSVNVTSAVGCTWTATSNVPWITVTTGASGTGNGTVTFSVAANTGIERTGTLTIAGQTFTVTQANGCTYALSATSANIPPSGGTGSVNVIAGTGCAWTAISNVPWITVTSGATGIGNGTVTFTVEANTGADRSGTITIAGQTFTVNQGLGCSYSLSPSSANFTAAGGTESFNVTSGAGCNWTATTSDSWITINSGTGSGNGSVSFTVQANAGPVRTGTISVNGQTFTVNQASGCTYTLSSTSTNISAAGANGSVNVTSAAGCNWTATSHVPWITINTGTTGNGNGTVTFSVSANISIERTGTITIAGQTFTVVQANGCTYTLSSTSSNVSAAGATRSVNVTSGTGCTWTATSNVSWITVTTGASGTGNGTVEISVASNTGPARTGTITIAGQTFTLNQAAGNAARRTAFDFDGDGKADLSVFRPDNGIWYLLNSQTGFTGAQFGISTDKPVPADYDGDGKTDLAVYRNGTWYLQRSQAGFAGIGFGAPTDIPAPADYDGDGRAELAVYRPSNGNWYFYNLANNQTSSVSFGIAEDKPVPADYDGDGKSDVAVYRPSAGTWFLQRSTLGFTGIGFGATSDLPVPADYDGDGKSDVAVFRPSTGVWYLLQSTAGFTGIQFGISTDLPVPADYDGDGRTDVAVYRTGTWYLQRSQAGFTGAAFGAADDRPIPNAFVR